LKKKTYPSHYRYAVQARQNRESPKKSWPDAIEYTRLLYALPLFCVFFEKWKSKINHATF